MPPPTLSGKAERSYYPAELAVYLADDDEWQAGRWEPARHHVQLTSDPAAR